MFSYYNKTNNNKNVLIMLLPTILAAIRNVTLAGIARVDTFKC